jgi:hypothetical protein
VFARETRQARRQQTAGDHVASGDGKRAGRKTAESGGFPMQPFNLGKHGAGAGNDLLPRRTQEFPPPRADEERQSGFTFQQLDLRAKRWLAHAQKPSGFLKSALVDDGA